MKAPITQRGVLGLANLSDAARLKFLKKLTAADLLAFDAAFEAWAAAGQFPPTGEGWRVWLMMAGRGFGKTRAGAEWIHRLALTGDKQIALAGATIDEARSIMVEGVSGLLSLARRHRIKVQWEPSKGRLRGRAGAWRNCFRAKVPRACAAPNMILRGSLALIDLLLAGSVEGTAIPNPPASPVIGTFYRVADGATGAFAGHDAALAGCSEGGWRFVAPVEGMRLTDRSSGVDLAYRGGAWTSGSVRAAEIVDGLKVVGSRGAAITDVTGGSVIDVEARAAIGQILARLRVHGLISG